VVVVTTVMSVIKMLYLIVTVIILTSFYFGYLHPVACIRSRMWEFHLCNDISVVFTILFLSHYMF
jgi:uncharacterized membrane protein YjgN (DUF898 family)